MAESSQGVWAWDMYPLAPDTWGMAGRIDNFLERTDGRNYYYTYPLEHMESVQGQPLQRWVDDDYKKIRYREAYIPTEVELALLLRIFPARDPHDPDWKEIATALIIGDYDAEKLPRITAPALLVMLGIVDVKRTMLLMAAAKAQKEPETSKGGGWKAKWPNVQKILENYSRSHPWPGLREAARIAQCNPHTVKNAMNHSVILRNWQKGIHDGKDPQVKATRMTDRIKDSLTGGDDPALSLDWAEFPKLPFEKAWKLMFENSTPIERHALEAKTDQERRELIDAIQHDPEMAAQMAVRRSPRRTSDRE